MHIRRLFLTLTLASAAALLILSACHTRAHPSNSNSLMSSSAEDLEPDSVSFKIQELSRQEVDGGEELTWLATHSSNAGVAKFQIVLILTEPRGQSPFSFSKCAFIRERDSQSSEFLRQVAKALEAKAPDTGKPKTSRLDFEVAVLGRDQSRGPGGGFASKPPGNWILLKSFVADGEGEFFLNLNSKEGEGEISMKDPDYGDIVLAELSRIF